MDKYLEVGISILRKLQEAGYEAYIAGGFVRDYLLSIPSDDIDITTNARPDDVTKLFKTIPTGIKYGTVTVVENDYSFEVTTYRCDEKYIDNRHPEIIYANDLAIDLSRRDFTINGMAMDCQLQIKDFYQGKIDLKQKIIRAIGDAKTRFTEDALRILRALYFVSKLGFSIEEETKKAMKEQAFLVANLSSERVYNEVVKIIRNQYQNLAFKLLVDLEVISYLPGLEKGLKQLILSQRNVSVEEFFGVCFKLNEEIPDYWRFSNKELDRYQRASDLANVAEDGNYNPLILYSYGQDICLLANRINVILGFPDCQEKIISEYKALPIKKTCDLVFKGQDIMLISNQPASAWLGEMVDDIKYNVIMRNLKNDYDEIKAYVIKKLAEMKY